MTNKDTPTETEFALFFITGCLLCLGVLILFPAALILKDQRNYAYETMHDVDDANEHTRAAWCAEHNGTIVNINGVNRCTKRGDMNTWLYMPRSYLLHRNSSEDQHR